MVDLVQLYKKIHHYNKLTIANYFYAKSQHARPHRSWKSRSDLAGIVFGVVLAMVSPSAAQDAGLLGSLFVGALKAVAPILVFILVAASIIRQKCIPVCVRIV